MALPAVYSGVLNTLYPLTRDANPPTLAGVSLGIVNSIPQSPHCAVYLRHFDSPDAAGSDLKRTDWEVVLHVSVECSPDFAAAETRLSELVQTLRGVFEAHLKLGQASVTRARVTSGDWSYGLNNGVMYRSAELLLSVVEKESVSYAA